MASFRIGLISDTHGLLRPQAVAALQGSDFIVHAGDIGDPAILERLAGIAPLTAVRGNNDSAAGFLRLADSAWLQVGSQRILVLHDIAALDAVPDAGGASVVIHGHSHKPAVERRGGVLYVNPGSAGPRRFRLPVGLAHLTVRGSQLAAELLPLAV
ncbi:MAG: metallophosphoesterase family protein [Nevskia sp.]|nr:metallophosphoesterase family protein [Nevskia sp.]